MLPDGKAERGFYNFAGTRASGTEPFVPVSSASFPVPLNAFPNLGVVAVGGPSTTNCPGTAEDPKAAEGYLCIYENTNEGGPVDIYVDPAFGRYGFSLSSPVGPGGGYELKGTWAVTD